MSKITKQDRMTYFAYYGWTIPVFLVAFWVIFFFIFQQMYAPRRYEKLVFFYAAYYLKDDSFHKELRKDLQPYGCLDIDYYSYSLDDKSIASKYNSLKDNCDYFVLSETDLKDMDEYIANQYMVIDDSLINKAGIPSDYEFYSFGETKYGIKLFDKDREYKYNDKFSNWINFSNGSNTDSFYLVINKTSINFNEEKEHMLGYYGLKWLTNGKL